MLKRIPTNHLLVIAVIACTLCIAEAQLSPSYALTSMDADAANHYDASSVHSGAWQYAGDYLRQGIQPYASDYFDAYRVEYQAIRQQQSIYGDRPMSLSDTKRWLARHAARPEALPVAYAAGYVAMVDGDHRTAYDIYLLVTPMDPDALSDAGVAYERGQLSLARGFRKEAKEDFEFVLEGYTGYMPRAHYHLGIIAEQEDEPDEAIRHYEKAKADSIYGSAVPYRLARLYSTQGRHEDVVSEGLAALNSPHTKNTSAIRRLIGRSYYELGQSEEALKYMSTDDEMEHTSTSPNDQYRIAQLYYERGDFAAAKSAFARLAHREDAIGEQAAYFLAYSAIKEGDLTKAQQAFSHLGRTADDATRRHEAMYNAGLLSAQLGRDREAAMALASIPKTAANYAASRSALYQVLLQTEDINGAINIVRQGDDRSRDMDGIRQQLYLKQGSTHFAAGRYAEARKSFKKSLDYPIDQLAALDARYLTGYAYYLADDHGNAALELQQYRTSAYEVDHSSQLHADFLLAMIPFQRGDYAEAEPLFHQTATRSAGTHLHDDVLVRLGDCAFHRRQYPSALDQYLGVIELDGPHKPYARYQAGLIHDLNEDAVQALVLLEQVPNLHPASSWAPRALLSAGQIYLKLGRFDEAAAPLDRLIEHYEQSDSYTEALLLMGLIHYNSGATAKAKSYYEEVISRQPSPSQAADAYRALEEIYVKDLKDPEAYIIYVEQTGQGVDDLKRDSLFFTAAEAQYREGDYARTITSLSDYLTSYPLGVYRDKALYARAESHIQLGQDAEAYADYASLAAKPNSPFYKRSLLEAADISHRVLNDYAKSIQWNQKVLDDHSLDSEHHVARLRLAHAYTKLKDHANSLSVAERILSDSRTSPEDVIRMNHIAGTSAYSLDQYEKALSYLRAIPASSDHTWDEEASYLIGAIYAKQGRSVEAHAALDRAINQGASTPEWVARSILLKSRLNYQDGQLFEAQAGLEAIITHFKDDARLTSEAEDLLLQVKAALAARDRVDSTLINE